MTEFRAATPDQAEFLDELFAAGLLIDSGVPGVYGRGRAFEQVRLGLDDFISRVTRSEQAERMRFPPLLPRVQLERVGYLKSFPHLAGSVFSFDGSERDAIEQYERASRHEDWSGFQQQTDLVLVPACCYPVYPTVAARGVLPAGGVTVDPGAGYVFRHEPSGDPSRLQIFHMRELVRIADPETVQAWRDHWRDRILQLFRDDLGLDAEFDVANDPFFGRTGKMLAANQREQALKFELLVQVAGPAPTAIASFNYHQSHFTQTYGIELEGGGEAQTACLGFGHERIALALFRTHGLDVDDWPDSVRRELWPA